MLSAVYKINYVASEIENGLINHRYARHYVNRLTNMIICLLFIFLLYILVQ